jgi:glycosyltransferase involved in cell wall biosynthesis
VAQSEPRLNTRVKSILCVHNYYRHAGGEDRIHESEAALLEQAGHVVTRYEEHNTAISNGLVTSIGATWNTGSFRRIQAAARASAPDVVHFQNIFPRVSPAAYFAAQAAGVPVVQTLHNFRLLCPGATFLRDGKVCEDCATSRSLRPALVHSCYRNSRAATAAVAAMIFVHRATGTWHRAVNLFVVGTQFARAKFISGGFPPERIVVKPNFVAPDPGVGDGHGGYALFVGRLSEEKGIRALADAWRTVSGIPLLVAGDGPLRDTAWPDGVTSLGSKPRERVFELMREARVLIFPSIWYEMAPMTIIEAFACGTPVVASNLGSIPEFVDDGRTGLLFRPGDAHDLAAKVRWAFDHPQQMAAMRREARREYDQKYTPERNYKLLMEIYEMAIENARRRRSAVA